MGYGLATDLAAIATALGSEYQSCTATVSPALELLVLSRHLRRDHPETIPKVDPKGIINEIILRHASLSWACLIGLLSWLHLDICRGCLHVSLVSACINELKCLEP